MRFSMFRFSRAAVAAITAAGAAVCAPSAWAGAAPLTLEPASPWNVEWADNACRLQRLFGTGEPAFLLRMVSYEPGDFLEFLVTGKEMRTFDPIDDLRLSLGAGGQMSKVNSLLAAENENGTGGALFGAHFASGPPPEQKGTDEPGHPIDPSFAAHVDHVILSKGSQSLTLRTGSMGKPIAALENCVNDLVKSWGLDPAVQASLTRTAEPMNRRLMVARIQRHYPAQMETMGKQGRVNIHTIVDAAGNVTSCSIPQSYNDPVFNQLSCDVIKNSRFRPALDKDGKPVPSYWNTTVIYIWT